MALTGRVTDEKGMPFVGVTVIQEGTTNGCVTDADGNYRISVPVGASVSFSYIGYKTQRTHVGVQTRVDIRLEPSDISLETVVVTALGIKKAEKSLGYSLQQVNSDAFDKVKTDNPINALNGKVAGLTVNTRAGILEDPPIKLRGETPIYVINGTPVTYYRGVSSDDIESITVLKGPQAAVLYGSRGANGVMIITTKNGRQSEKMAINVRLESGISMPTRVQDIADGVTYMENYNEALRTRTPAGETYVQHFSDEKITGTRNRLNPYVYPDNDWYSMLFKDFTVNENMNLNVRGGGKVVDYFLNASIFNENGILKKPAESKFNTNINSQKYLFQANVGAQLTRTTRVSLKMNTQLLFWHRPVEEVKDLFYYTCLLYTSDAADE